MKLPSVRRYLKIQKNTGLAEIRTGDSVLIFDGGFLKGLYKASGCYWMLGGEYDRYASYLRNTFSPFLKCKIECIVIFNGAMIADNETRKEIHQNVMNRAASVSSGCRDAEYCEPIFVKDVQMEVLKDMNIKCFICEYNHTDTLLSLAEYFDCPIVTNNFEYSLFGVSCIIPNSIKFDVGNGFKCTIYHQNRKLFPMNSDMISILLALSDEDMPYYSRLPQVFQCNEKYLFSKVQHWVRKQNKQSAIAYMKKYLSPQDVESLLMTISSIQTLFQRKHNIIIKVGLEDGNSSYVSQDHIKDLIKPDKFKFNVLTGRIAVPYINLFHNNTFSGSWFIYDESKNDAILVALDIVFYVLGILTNSTNLKITFIGRHIQSSHVGELDFKLKSDVVLKLIYGKGESKEAGDPFRVVVGELMSNFDFTLLDDVPEDCHLLIISLVYYCVRTSEDFKVGAYSILMSYFMLGPISNEMGLLKRSNVNLMTGSRSAAVVQPFIDYFYVNEAALNDCFQRDIIHRFAEYEHCLQHINYLNKICGETIRCTVYHKAINGTFLYNIFVHLKDVKSPLKYLKMQMKCDPMYEVFKKYVNVFEKCYDGVRRSMP